MAESLPHGSQRGVAKDIFIKAQQLDKELSTRKHKSERERKVTEELRESVKLAFEEAILTDFVHCQQKDVDQTLWKSVFYRRIEEFRKVAKKQTATKDELDQFKAFLDSGSAFYISLFKKIVALAGDRASRVDGTDPTGKCVRDILQRTLIFLGDLERYKEQFSGRTKDWSLTTKYYFRANRLLPDLGNAHNQLAVVATYQSNEFEATYRYFRSLAVRKPYTSARENLIQQFERNRQKFGGAASLDKEHLLSLSSDQLMVDFLSRFVRLHGVLFTNTGLDVFDEYLPTLLMQLGILVERGEVPELLVLKIFVMNIFGVHNVLGAAPVATAGDRPVLAASGSSYAEISLKAERLRLAISLALQSFAAVALASTRVEDFMPAYLGPNHVFIQWLSRHTDLLTQPPPPQSKGSKAPSRPPVSLSAAMTATATLTNNIYDMTIDPSNRFAVSPSRRNGTTNASNPILPEDIELRGFVHWDVNRSNVASAGGVASDDSSGDDGVVSWLLPQDECEDTDTATRPPKHAQRGRGNKAKGGRGGVNVPVAAPHSTTQSIVAGALADPEGVDDALLGGTAKQDAEQQAAAFHRRAASIRTSVSVFITAGYLKKQVAAMEDVSDRPRVTLAGWLPRYDQQALHPHLLQSRTAVYTAGSTEVVTQRGAPRSHQGKRQRDKAKQPAVATPTKNKGASNGAVTSPVVMERAPGPTNAKVDKRENVTLKPSSAEVTHATEGRPPVDADDEIILFTGIGNGATVSSGSPNHDPHHFRTDLSSVIGPAMLSGISQPLASSLLGNALAPAANSSHGGSLGFWGLVGQGPEVGAAMALNQIYPQPNQVGSNGSMYGGGYGRNDRNNHLGNDNSKRAGAGAERDLSGQNAFFGDMDDGDDDAFGCLEEGLDSGLEMERLASDLLGETNHSIASHPNYGGATMPNPQIPGNRQPAQMLPMPWLASFLPMQVQGNLGHPAAPTDLEWEPDLAWETRSKG